MHSTINLIAVGYQIVKLRWRRFCTKSSTDKQSHRFHTRAKKKKVYPSSYRNMSFYTQNNQSRGMQFVLSRINEMKQVGKAEKWTKYTQRKKKCIRVLIKARREISQTLLLCLKKCNLFLYHTELTCWPCHPPSLWLMVGFSSFLSAMCLSQNFLFLLHLS